MSPLTIGLAGIGAVPIERLADLRHAIEQARRPVLAGFKDPEASARVLKMLRELEPPSPEPEPVSEHVGPVVTSFDQALYLLSMGWRPGKGEPC